MNPSNVSKAHSNPYVGPRPFQRGDSRYFFGRDLEANQLLALVLSERIVLFYAQSGAGKSSLINAKLIDALETEQDFFVLPVGRVSGRGTSSAEGQVVENVFIYSLLNDINDKTSEGDKPTIIASMTLSEYLHLYSGQAPTTEPGEATQVEALPQILIIDQFEELFTTHLGEWKKRENFFLQLRQAMDDDPKLWVLLAMREDFIAAIDPYSYLFPNKLRARFYMQRLGEIAAGQAISLPAKVAGREFDKDATSELVKRLRLVPGEQGEEQSLDQFVEPLILQVVCFDLWESLADKPVEERINRDDIEQTSNVDTSLTSYYEKQVLKRVLDEAKPGESPLSEMALRLWIETHLITAEGRRSFVYEEKGPSASLPAWAIHSLYDKRLLNQGRREERIWYELAHDWLVRPIRTANEAWWREQGLLAQAARAWLISGRAESALILDPLLEQQMEMADEANIDPLVIEFMAQARKKVKRDLSTTGWGVIFAENADSGVRQALVELLQHRRRQATQRCPHYYREFTYRAGMTSLDFLKENNATEGVSDPEFIPYFLLIVGDPESIPFTFQYQLDVDYAVGRIYFNRIVDYATYAHTVVEAERKGLALPRQATIYSASHPGVQPTQLTIEQMVRPTVDSLRLTYPEWEIRALLTPEESGKTQLGELIGGDQTPSLLFTTSVSPSYPADSPDLEINSGAMVTSDWSGPPNKVEESQVFHAADIQLEANLFGLVSFFMTGRSAGMPRTSDYTSALGHDPNKLQAQRDFVSRLPMRLLSHPNGGALAVVGHVDEAYFYSIGGLTGKGKSKVFRDALARLLSGLPVGVAMEVFNQRYAMLASMMFGLQSQTTGTQDQNKMRQLEMAAIDARNYIILGDPAVRLAVGKSSTPAARRPPFHAPVLTQDIFFHPDPLLAAHWSPDGTHLLTVSQGTLRVWNAEAPRLEWAVQGQSIVTAAWSPDGNLLAALAANGEVLMLDRSANCQELFRLSPGPDQAGQISWRPDGSQLAVTSDVMRRGVYLARIWDLATAQVIQVLRGHTDIITSIQYHPDGKRILTASNDGSVREFDLDGEQIAIYSLPENASQQGISPVVNAFYSADGTNILTASANGTTRLISAQQESTWVSDRAINAAALSPDEESVVVADQDGTARSWKLADRQRVFEFSGHFGPVNVVQFHPGGDRLLTGGVDGDLRLWRQPRWLPNPGGTVNLACYSPDSASLASAYSDDHLAIWDTASLDPMFISYNTRQLSTMVFSPDNACLATGDRAGKILIWNAKDGSLHLELVTEPDIISTLAFSPDGRWLLSYSSSKKLVIWDVSSGHDLLTRDADSYITRARFSLDGRLVFMLNLEGTLDLFDWNTDTGQTIKINHPGGIRCGNLGPGGKLLATGGDDRSVRVWRIEDGAEVSQLQGHQGRINHVAFSPDGERLLSTSIDRTVRIWDIDDQREIQAFCDSPGEVLYATFSPDERNVLARWQSDSQIKGSGFSAWNTADGLPFISWSLPAGWIKHVTLRPDGKQILALTNQGYYLLPFLPGLLPSLANDTRAVTLDTLPGPATAQVGVAF